MSIKSYLAWPKEGQLAPLAAALTDLPGCAVVAPENRDDVLILVTETADEPEETRLHARLDTLPPLQCLALVFAHRGGEDLNPPVEVQSEIP